MFMFGHLRPKPDARMLRRIARAWPCRPTAVCWSRTPWCTRRRRAASAWARCGCSASCAAGRRSGRRSRALSMRPALRRPQGARAAALAGLNAARCTHPRSGVARSVFTCRRGAGIAVQESNRSLPAEDPPAAVMPDLPEPSGADPSAVFGPAVPMVALVEPAAQAAARKRPRPGERRVQILQTLATHARAARRRPHHHRGAGRAARRSARRRCTATSPARRRCSRG